VVPWHEARSERLPGGVEILVRPLRMSDEEPLQRLFYELSDESVYRRFFTFRRAHPHEEMQKMCDLDYDASVGLVACEPERGDLIGVARYDVDAATQLAEIAFVVRDDWQGRGVGSRLLGRAAEIARARGLRGFTADVLAGNTAMLMVFQKSGLQVTSRIDGGVYSLVMTFDAPPSRAAGRG
jgi:GNAT superfamily N-acetyltransferase